MLQDGGGYLELAGYSPAGGVQTKLAEKRKLIEEIAHNDVKKVSFSLLGGERGVIFVQRLANLFMPL